MNKYYISIHSWATYVKEADFFISQGGLKEPWGKTWKLIYANSIEDARNKGKENK